MLEQRLLYDLFKVNLWDHNVLRWGHNLVVIHDLDQQVRTVRFHSRRVVFGRRFNMVFTQLDLG